MSAKRESGGRSRPPRCETLSALFSSKEAEEMLSSSGTKRTLTLAVSVCVRGLISASIDVVIDVDAAGLASALSCAARSRDSERRQQQRRCPPESYET